MDCEDVEDCPVLWVEPLCSELVCPELVCPEPLCPELCVELRPELWVELVCPELVCPEPCVVVEVTGVVVVACVCEPVAEPELVLVSLLVVVVSLVLVPLPALPPVPEPGMPGKAAPALPGPDCDEVTSPVSEPAWPGPPRPAARCPCEAPGRGTALADATGTEPEPGNCSEVR